jgi:DNA-binding transcriptional LysR family regulator
MKLDFTKLRGSIDGLPAFLLVAERRSFKAAAQELGVSPSAVSQKIRALEERLGVALLQRTTRSVGLTEAGERFLHWARPALEGLGQALDAVSSLAEKPSGLLRLNASRGFIGAVINDVLRSFLAANPNVQVEIWADDGLTDIVAEGFDAGFRLGESLEADMIAVRVSPPFRFSVVGSPDYFARHGRPMTPQDLIRFPCIRFRQTTSQSIYRWEFMAGNHPVNVVVNGPIIVNDSAVNIAAALNGIGLAYVAEPLVWKEIEEGSLEPVLTKFLPMTPGVFMYFPGRAQAMPKLRAFIDHMRAALSEFERSIPPRTAG